MHAPPRARLLRHARLALFLLTLAMLAGPAALLPGRATAQAPSPALVAPVRLFAGWNDVVYQGIPLPVGQALGSVADAVPVVWEFDASSQRWNVWAAGAPAAARSLGYLQPGGLYFLRATRATFWMPPRTPPPPVVAEDAPPATDDATADNAPATDGALSDDTTEPGLWEVRFTRTTPLFALQDSLRFDETGSGVVATLNAPDRAVLLPAALLASVAATLTANDFLQQHPLDVRSGCGSCFHYALTVRAADGRTVTIQADDVGLSGALLTTVNQLVAALLDSLG